MAKQPVPFHKQRWFLQLGAVIGLISALVGIVMAVRPLFESKPEQAAQNTEIVVDRSQAMGGPIHGPGSQRKLQVAQDAVNLILKTEASGDRLALRAFGGQCADDAKPPQVPFPRTSRSDTDRVRQELAGLKPDGQATLVTALFGAIGDFKNKELFDGVSKRIIVITGSKDACKGDIQKIAEQLKGENPAGVKGAIKLDLNFIGIGLDTEAKQEMDAMAERTGGAAHFVDDPAQLSHVIEAMEARRVTRSAILLNEYLNASTDSVNVVIGAQNKQDYAAADAALKQAKQQFDKSELPFRNLEKRQSGEQFAALYRQIFEAANKSRDLQKTVLALVEDIQSKAKAGNQAALKEAIDKFNSTKDAYNQSQGELLKLVNELHQKAQGK
jgi:hypothetical protein